MNCAKITDDFRVCSPPPGAALDSFPSLLSETGLYTDISTHNIGPGVEAYTPRFQLWSDGAQKSRWIMLPAGQKIDTQDSEVWSFPMGTRFWKEFRVDGRRVETRLLRKTAGDDRSWIGVSYIWNDDGTDAYKAEWGGINVNGTQHNVPAAAECMGCHGGRQNRILGFSATQLSGDAGEITVAEAIEREWLSHPPTPLLPLPGNEIELAALGYLHANCSHCHNSDRPNDDKQRCFNPKKDFSFLLTSEGHVDETETYQTAIGKVIERGDASGSRVIREMEKRGYHQGMPPLGTETVDRQGVETVGRWIDAL